MEILEHQYKMIQRTRGLLFDYCETLSQKDYIKNLESFGGGSIRSLHVHVAECYQFWLGNFSLKKSLPALKPESVNNIKEMKEIFLETDNIVNEFFSKYKNQENYSIKGKVPWPEGTATLTPIWLYTHTTTHEFHHKGQIVSMSRHLGYIPSDTDLIEPKFL